MLEKGSTSFPTGNLIVYSKVIGENPFQSGCEVIASNIVVSFLKINENMPVVTFPPISFQTMEDLQKTIAKNLEFYDIARLPDFIMPDSPEQGNKYLQERMEQYNSFVMRYVEFCKNREKNIQKKENSHDDNSSNLTTLMEASLNYRTSTGLSKEVSKQKLEKLLEDYSSRFPNLDLENFRKVIYNYSDSIGDELASLYIKKFNAIQNEEYEEASLLKRKIMDIETLYS
ncbi:MAG: hypothetical protein H7A24_08850 [Leptospiraceae bacterium]|nr:hypothetical protein [Leptospiraceae bacterium]MCP5511976.1 hypothetical protein [Leptospiraceae bacterium]